MAAVTKRIAVVPSELQVTTRPLGLDTARATLLRAGCAAPARPTTRTPGAAVRGDDRLVNGVVNWRMVWPWVNGVALGDRGGDW